MIAQIIYIAAMLLVVTYAVKSGYMLDITFPDEYPQDFVRLERKILKSRLREIRHGRW